MCYICMNDDSSDMICLTSCQHTMHLDCLRGQLAARWTGKRISFGYLTCGECRVPIAHPSIDHDIESHLQLKQRVERLCIDKYVEDGYMDPISQEVKPSADQPVEAIDANHPAVSLLACFMCVSCDQPFCGGRVDCAEDAELDASSLCCPSCAFDAQKCTTDNIAASASSLSQAAPSSWLGKCVEHGYVYAVYKCDSCCAVATWDCRSNHYCERCHNLAGSAKNYPCPGRALCPLGIEHPPNQPGVHGEIDNGFVIGCTKCFLGPDLESSFTLASDSSAEEAAHHWNERF